MSAPEPNSPEAKRAAQKVRNIFFFIAAANIVFVAIVMWPSNKPPAEPAQPAEAESVEKEPEAEPDLTESTETNSLKASVQEMEVVYDRVLAAYNARDAERFAREFSAQAIPPVDEEFFRKMVIGLYHEEFGDLTKKKITRETNADPDYGMVVYEVESKKGIKAKVSANFRREGNTLKVVQWRVEKF
jgi:hypothetical protein